LYGLKEEQFSTESERLEILRAREKEIKEFLRNKDVRTKLDILQNIRYQLSMELNAYTIENGYIDKMTPKGTDLSCLKIDTDKYLFKEKIDIIKRIAFEVIKKERKKIEKNSANLTRNM
jgi:hypothetical protein